MKQLLALGLLLLIALNPILAQNKWVKYSTVNPSDVQIARDKWGVPHIFSKTDAGVAYGLAFATAEDDFKTMQFLLLAAKGMQGRNTGKDGAAIDFVAQLLRIKETVEDQYDKTFTPEFKKVLEGYVDGINAYAFKHKDEVLVKGAFPLTPKELACAYTLGMVAMTGVDGTIKSMLDGSIPEPDGWEENELGKRGSNGFAFSSRITTDNKTYLDINSHQPLEGPLSWYEAHLCSEEGWNIVGGTFPGGLCIFHGVNENLGWAHTVNGFDKVDVYQLEMHPKKKYIYKFDDKWEKLDVKSAKLKVKLNKWLTLPIGKKIYWSKYGATIRAKNGKYYAIRFPAYMQIGGLQQWFYMNKAKNFTEFKGVLNMQEMCAMNIIYADREDNIYYLFNGLIPKRDSSYNWSGTLPGNTSKTLWTEYYPVSYLPQVENPECGYVYNSNNTPYNSSCEAEDPNPANFHNADGIQTNETNRGLRFRELVSKQTSFSYDDFKRIKYDINLPDSIVFKISLEPMFNSIVASKYPELEPAFNKIRKWNRNSDTTNTDAALVMMAVTNLYQRRAEVHTTKLGDVASEDFYVSCIKDAQDYLVKHFGSIDIPLGRLQRHARGNVDLACSGFPDVMASTYSLPYKDGKLKVAVGDSYIMLVRFTKDELPEIQTVNAYGASNRPDSKHYTDQMQLYVDKKTKTMTLNKADVLRDAEMIYNPD